MYEFRDLQPRAQPSGSLPVEALSYAGKWLDREIPEFTTLVVEGRSGFEREINAPNRVGDGDLYLSSRIKSRKITVTFKLDCENIEKYNQAVNKLHQLTYSSNVEVKFADDQNYKYFGTIENITLDKPLLSTTGKIEIVCPDPYKYSVAKTITSSTSPILIADPDIVYPQTPKMIEFTPANAIAMFEMRTNKHKVFTLNEAIDANKTISINFENLVIRIGGITRMMSLKLSSNFNDFYIQNGTTITVNSSGRFRMTYEVKRL